MLAARGYDYAHALHRTSHVRDLPEHDRRATSRRRWRSAPASRRRDRRRRRACTTSCSRATRPTGTSSGGWRAGSTARSWSRRRRCTSARRRRRRRDGLAALGRGPADLPAARDRRAAGRRGRRAQLGPEDRRHVDRVAAKDEDGLKRDRRRPRDVGAQGARRRADRRQRPAGVLARGGRRARARACSRSSATPTSRPRARRAATRGCAPACASRSTASASASSGDYALASTSHVFRGHDGLPDALHDQRPLAAHARSTCVNPSPPARFGASVVVGVVTQNEDPDKHGPRARQVPGPRRRGRGLVGAHRRARRRQAAAGS